LAFLLFSSFLKKRKAGPRDISENEGKKRRDFSFESLRVLKNLGKGVSLKEKRARADVKNLDF